MQIRLTKLVSTTAILSMLMLGACSSAHLGANKERRNYTLAVRQYAPEPVYNRLRTVYLPDPLPLSAMGASVQSAARIDPIFEFDMQDVSLEQTARTLAKMARYTSYCSSIIADRKITVTTVGTLDEIARLVAEETGVNVVVDHANKEVRFLADGKPVKQAVDVKEDFDGVDLS